MLQYNNIYILVLFTSKNGGIKMIEKDSKIWQISDSLVVTIPASLVNDSGFPFKFDRDKEGKLENPIDVNVKIDMDKKCLIIS